MTAPVSIERDGSALVVTLNRPDKLNAFDETLVEGLHTAVAQAHRDGARAMILRANGKGFSGGFDLSNLDEMSDGDLLRRFVRVEQVLQAVAHAPFATIALVHGACYGAAADLVAACQTRIATPDARFRMPGAFFGLVLGTGRLSALCGCDYARQLVQRAKPFEADEALQTGFITDVGDQADWPKVVAGRLGNVTAFDADVYAQMSERQRTDTRDADLMALVASVTSSSIKERLQNYLASLSK